MIFGGLVGLRGLEGLDEPLLNLLNLLNFLNLKYAFHPHPHFQFRHSPVGR
jgi:hypothetical protein